MLDPRVLIQRSFPKWRKAKLFFLKLLFSKLFLSNGARTKKQSWLCEDLFQFLLLVCNLFLPWQIQQPCWASHLPGIRCQTQHSDSDCTANRPSGPPSPPHPFCDLQQYLTNRDLRCTVCWGRRFGIFPQCHLGWEIIHGTWWLVLPRSLHVALLATEGVPLPRWAIWFNFILLVPKAIFSHHFDL